MRAVVIENGALHVADDRGHPRAGPGEALVRMRLAGICGTDLALLEGYADFAGVPGHEFVGEVVEAPGADDLVGQRVVGDINVAPAATARERHHHADRRVLGIRGLDGAFAEFLVLPTANLTTVPDAVRDRDAVFAEPLAAAMRAVEQAGAAGERRVLVVGAGRLGCLCALAFRERFGRVEAVSRHPERVAFLGRSGVDVVAPGADRARAEVVVDTTGAADGFALARALVAPRGMLILKSTCAPAVQPELDFAALVVDEVTLVGSRCGDVPSALDAITAGRFDLEPVIEAVYPLSRAPEAFEHAARPGVLKVLLAPDAR
jgi:2-desacetyl-2-hydroxyethyl bacteriochlorophyllide A dehydrogenase